jgi:hypothetical protein
MFVGGIAMPIYSLQYAFEQQTDKLRWQAVIAQAFGGSLLIIPTVFLPTQFRTTGGLWAIVVLVYTAVFVGLWYRDYLYGRRIRPGHRLDHLRNSLGLLVPIDLAVIFFLIGSTGGIANSHLTGVLLLIPCVMSIVAIKPRAFFLIATGLVLVLLTCASWYAMFDGDPLALFASELGVYCGKSSDHGGYLYAVSSIAILSIMLIILEKRFIKPRFLTDKWSFNEILNLSPKHEYDPFLGNDVNRGFRRYKRYLDETNIPDPHISLVHNPQATFSQAYILAYPSYRTGRRDDAEDIAFVTFASHWIDDCFDAIYATEILDEVGEEEMEKLTLESVCGRMKDIGIDKMAQHVLDCAKDKELVEAGLFRVMLAGLIQRAPADITDELVKLYRETYKNKEKLDKQLADKIDNVDTELLLATARTSFGLILGCESPRDSQERNHLDSYACLFDLILCPLVLFHDLPSETRWEQGNLPTAGTKLFNDLIDIAELAVQKLPDYVGQDAVRGAVRAKQLQIVRDLYLDLVPRDGKDGFKRKYSKQLNEFIRELEKGRHTAV